MFSLIKRAENGTRTRDPNLGKVVLYQLSYFRILFVHFPKCGCKGNAFFGTAKTFSCFFSKNDESCRKYWWSCATPTALRGRY